MMNPRFRVLNRDPLYDYREDCKITQGIDMALQNTFFTPKNGDETEYWIKQICANHSCIRSVHFRFVAEAPKSVVMQIIRATKGHPQPEVQSSRPDWTGKERSSDPYEEKLFAQDHTAESFIEMAKQRLCKKTEANTRKFMELLVETLKAEKDPFLKAVGYCCVPACEWLGGRCPELNCCGKCPKISEERIKLYHKEEKENGKM